MSDTKIHISVPLDPELVAWVAEYADDQHITVADAIGEAIELFKHNRGLRRLLETLGGTDDLTPEERAAFEEEMRAAEVTK